MFDFCRGQGFLGTTATLCADINLILQIVLGVMLLIGAYFAVKKNFDVHQKIQATVVVLNFFLIVFIMATAYTREIVPGLPANLAKLRAQIGTLHAVLGLVTWLAGVYIVLRASKSTKNLIPEKLRVKKYKPFMRTLLGAWMGVILLGVGTYFVWYQPRGAGGQTGNGDGTPTAVAVVAGEAQVPVQNFDYLPHELIIPVGTTIHWKNFDEAPHTITFDDNSVDSGRLELNDDFAQKFDSVGTFAYYCAFHGAPGGAGMAASVRVVAANEVAALPTEVVPPSPTPRATPPLPPRRPLGQPVAVAAFQDTLTANDGLYIQNIEPLAPPPAGQAYEVWLLGAGVANGRTSLGLMTVGADGKAAFNFVSTAPAGERVNLLAMFNALEITLEPANDTDPASSGQIAYAAQLPSGALVAVRSLMVSATDTPNQTAFAVGARRYSEEAARQTTLQASALAAGNLKEVKRRAEALLNLLEGQSGTHYGDTNKDGKVQDPADGFGLLQSDATLGYIQGAFEFAGAADKAADATDAIHVHSRHVQICAQQTQAWATDLSTHELAISQAADLETARGLVGEAAGLADKLLHGFDVNGDGAIEPVSGECGTQTLYQHAQYLAAFGLVPASDIIPTAVPTPVQPTAVPVPGLFSVAMQGGEFLPRVITLTLGSTLEWNNGDTVQHSATSDTDVWDTSLLKPGAQGEFTFTQAGTFPYYCLLHGAPGGVGMSGQVVVTP